MNEQIMGQLGQEEDSTIMNEKSPSPAKQQQQQQDKVADEFKEMKVIDEDLDNNKRCNTAMASGKVADIHIELTAVKESLTAAAEELKNKDRYIESLKIELEKGGELEERLAEKEAEFRELKEELAKVQSFESEAMELLSEGKKRIHELKEEIEKRKASENNIYDSFVAQTKELEKTKADLEEARQEVKSLHENMDNSSEAASQSSVGDNNSLMDSHCLSLESELQLAKESLARALEEEKVSSTKAKSLAKEVSKLKNELKATTEAEENNKKAMDDLAMALKEVITEAHQAKENLSSTKDELQKSKGEVENLKAKLKNVEEMYNEVKKEADRYKNTTERLRLEAEETLMAWNGKEMGFVQCIRKAEDERSVAQEDSKRLLESLKEAENTSKQTKEENQKLRDIMKQAFNEANVAKAAGIAKEENSELKTSMSKKDDALSFLSQGNETLEINEVAAFENIKELKLLFCEATATSAKEWETEDIIQEVENNNNKKQNPADHIHIKEHKDDSHIKEHVKKPKHHKSRSTCLSLKFPYGNYYKHKDAEEDHHHHKNNNTALRESDEDSDSDYSDPLRGSIFDVAETPTSAAAANHHQQKKSASLVTDDEATNSEAEFDHLDAGHFDEEDDRSSRKKRALLRRFGDLISRRISSTSSLPNKKEQPNLE